MSIRNYNDAEPSSTCSFECKFNEAPKVTKSTHSALADLDLQHLWVVYPGAARYHAHEKITMLPLADIAALPQEIERVKG